VKFEEKLTYRSTQKSSTVTKDKEQHALKDEKQSIVHNLGGEEELSPSIHVKDPYG
jgi:hypothetical protein